jgi:hypothetical protein
VADKPIKSLSEVNEAVDKSEGKELAFQVLRAGKTLTVAVTPAERYGAGNPYKPPAPASRDAIDLDISKLEETIREKLRDAGVDVRLQLIQPGRFVPRGVGFSVAEPADFPADLSIVLRKEGQKPAEIEVKQGDKTWTVNENELDSLPEDVRKHVERYLGRGPTRFTVALPGGRKFNVPIPPVVSSVSEEEERVYVPRSDIQTRDRVRGALERRIDELSHDMERMRDRVESLRRNLREELDRPVPIERDE